MVEGGQEIGSPGGMKLRFVRTGAETDGELLEMEATYSGDGGMPPTHLHPRQAERFEVIEGAVRAIIGDQERVFETGQSFEVPVGTPHQMGAETDADALGSAACATHGRVLRAPLRRRP